MKFILPTISKKIIFLRNITLIGMFLAVSSLFFLTTPVHAIDTQSISAYPTYSTDTDPRSKSWFIYSLPAGVKKTDSVTVVNNGKQPLVISLYAVDSTKDNNGNFTLAAEGVKSTVGGWVSLSAKEVTLNAGERKSIPFTITIPANTSVGDYSGGIIFQLAPQKSTTTTGMALNVISRVGVRIYETVPSADQLKMTVSNVKYSLENNHVAVTFTVENNGTVHISPTGVLSVRDTFGRVAESIALDSQLGVVVPGKPITLTVPTHVLAPLFGWETATVAIYYSPTKAAVANVLVMPNPWAAVVIVAIVVVLVGLFVMMKHKKHAASTPAAEKEVTTEKEKSKTKAS